MPRRKTASQGRQINLAEWAAEHARERARIEQTNTQRAARRGYLIFAIDPDRSPAEPDYEQVYATEARTPNEAAAKIRPLASGRRLHTYLATGTHKDQLPDARWVA